MPTIGDAYVEVHADTSKTRDEIRKGLTKAMSGLGDEIGKKFSDDFSKSIAKNFKASGVQQITKDMKKEFGKAGEESGEEFSTRFSKKVNDRLSALRKDSKVSIDLDLATGRFDTEFQRVKQQLIDLSGEKATPKIDLGDGDFESKITNIRTKMTELGALNAKPKVELQGEDALRAQIQTLENSLNTLAVKQVRPKLELGGYETVMNQLRVVESQLRAIEKSWRVRIDLDVGAALTAATALRQELERIDRQRVEPQVDVDVADDIAKLAALRAAIGSVDRSRANININSGSIGAATSGLMRLNGAIRAIAIGGAIVALAPYLASIGAAAVQAAQSIGLIPAGLLAIGAAIGTAVMGFKGLGSAMSAASKQSEGAGAAAASNAQRQQASARAIASAQRAVQDAIRDAARAAEDASRRIADAQRAVQDAIRNQARVAQNGSRQIADAQRAVKDAYEAAADSAKNAARRVADAQRTVRDATEDAARAIETAQRRVVQANEQLVESNKRVTRSEEALSDARRQAIYDLEDIREKTSDNVLSQEGAAISLERALERQRKINGDVTSTDLDRREAALNVAEAQDRVSDAARTTQRDLVSLEDAEKRGIENSRTMISARDQLESAYKSQRDAIQGVSDAYRNQADAQESSARRIADAQRGLQDALEAQSEAAVQANRRIEDAERRLSETRQQAAEANADAARQVQDAQRNLADAQRDAARAQEDAARRVQDAQRALAEAYQDAAQKADAGAAAANKYADAMKKLSPAGQELVRTLLDLKPAWKDMQLDVQQHMLVGIAGRVRELSNAYLPVLRQGLIGIADGFNQIMHKSANALLKKEQIDATRIGLDNTGNAVKILSNAMEPLIAAFATLGRVGSTFLPRLAQNVVDVANKFNTWIQAKDANGELWRDIDTGLKTVAKFGKIIWDVGGILNSVFKAGNASGKPFIDMLVDGTDKLNAFLKTPEGAGQLTEVFTTIREAMGRLWEMLKIIWPAVREGIQAFSELSAAASPVVTTFLQVMTPALQAFFQVLQFLSPVLGPIIGLFISWKLATMLLGAVFSPFIAGWAALTGALGKGKSALDWITGGFKGAKDAIEDELPSDAKKSEAMADIGDKSDKAGKSLKERFVDGVKATISAIGSGISSIGSWIASMGRAAASAVSTAATTVAAWVRTGAAATASGAKQAAAWVAAKASAAAGLIADLGRAAAAWARTAAAAVASGLKQAGAWIAAKAAAAGALIADLARAAAAWASTAAAAVASGLKQAGAWVAARAAAAAGLIADLGRVAAAWAAAGLAAVVNGAKMAGQAVVMGVIRAATAAWTAAQWLLNAALAANPIGLIVVAIAALVAGLIYAYQNSETFRNIVTGALSAVGEVFKTSIGIAKSILQGLVDGFNWVMEKASALGSFLQTWGPTILAIFMPFIGIPLLIYQNWGTITEFFSNLWNTITAIFNTATGTVKAVWDQLWAGMGAIFGMVWGGIVATAQTIWNNLVATFTTVWNSAKETWNTVWTGMGVIFGAIWGAIVTVATTIWNQLSTAFSTVFNAAKATWDAIWNAVSTVFKTIWDNIKAVAIAAWQAIAAFFTGDWGKFKAAWDNFLNTLKQAFVNIWNAIKTAAVAIWNAINSFFVTAFNAFKTAFTNIWNTIKNVFTSTWNTIKSTATTIWNSISSFFSGAFNAFKNMFSNIFNTVAGIWRSVWDGIANVAKSIWNGITSTVKAGVNAFIGIINGMIAGVNRVTGAVGIPAIPNIPLLEAGGKITQEVEYAASGAKLMGKKIGPGFMTNGPQAVVGEGNRAHPEFVVPTDPKYRDRALDLFTQLGDKLLGRSAGGTRQLASGGTIDPIAGAGRARATQAIGGAVNAVVAETTAQIGRVASALGSTIDALGTTSKLASWSKLLGRTASGPSDLMKARVNRAGYGRPTLFDSGGYLPTGTSAVQNNTGKPEMVLPGDPVTDFKDAMLDVYRRLAPELAFALKTGSQAQIKAAGALIANSVERTANVNTAVKQVMADTGIADLARQAAQQKIGSEYSNIYKNITTITDRLQYMSGNFKYTVRAGDTLDSIAAKFGTTVKELQAGNKGLTAQNLAAGNAIMIPSDDALAKQRGDIVTKQTTYKAGANETLAAIAKKYAMTITQLQAMNPMLKTGIGGSVMGQTLKVLQTIQQRNQGGYVTTDKVTQGSGIAIDTDKMVGDLQGRLKAAPKDFQDAMKAAVPRVWNAVYTGYHDFKDALSLDAEKLTDFLRTRETSEIDKVMGDFANNGASLNNLIQTGQQIIPGATGSKQPANQLTINDGAFQVVIQGNADQVTVEQLQTTLDAWGVSIMREMGAR